MAIKYDPKDATLCIPEGEYTATLDFVEEATSKAGNDMYVLSFVVYAGEQKVTLKDWIVIPQFVWKLKRLARAFGVEDQFKEGKFDPEAWIGHNLVLEVGVKEYGGEDQNTVSAYFPATKVTATGTDDELGF